jgi:mRNA interferase HigB
LITFTSVNIIVKRAILFYADKFPQAKTALLTWHTEFLKAEFMSFNELKEVYGSASIVANQRVVFNIRGNEYRLVVSVNFKQQAAYIIWFGTHKQYDKIDVETVEFDIRILNYKTKK